MTHSFDRHRKLDRGFGDAVDRDGEDAPGGGHALVQSRDRLPDQRTFGGARRAVQGSRVLLATLSVRTSERGTEYLAGYLGKARVVAFRGQPDRFGNETWDVFVSEPDPRPGPAGMGATPASDRTAP